MTPLSLATAHPAKLPSVPFHSFSLEPLHHQREGQGGPRAPRPGLAHQRSGSKGVAKWEGRLLARVVAQGTLGGGRLEEV